MRRRAFFTVALLVFGLLVGVVTGEVGIRVYASWHEGFGRLVRQADPLAISIEPHGQLGYRQRPNRIFHYSNGTYATSNALGYRGPVVSIAKPRGTFRIVLLGGSTTHGWGVQDGQTIDAYMRAFLSERHAGLAFEVVNLAFDGYDSHQLVERLRTDGLRLAPDLIIVNAGINDVRNARFDHLGDPDPRTLIWEGALRWMREQTVLGGPSVWTRIKHYSQAARLPGLVWQHLMSERGRKEQGVVAPNPEAAALFERNLERIFALASTDRIPVLFSTPPSSLLTRYRPEAPPERDYWIVNAATTQRVRDELSRRMQVVVDRARSRGYDVSYMTHNLAPELFLDDCHLTADGNRRLALDLARSRQMQLLIGRAGPAAARS
jgi:lysophospholipase L1-like esterase